MGSVPDEQTVLRCGPIIEDAARRTAVKLVLPWQVEELRTAAFRGVQAAADRHTDTLGMPFEDQARPWIIKETAAAGDRLKVARDTTERRPHPPADRIEFALGFFSAKEWRRLIGHLDGQDTGALWVHAHGYREHLEEVLGRSKLYDIFDAVGTRNVEILCRSGPWRKTVITDAMWAYHWTELARRQNVARAARPSKNRSWAEVGRPNNIAESLTQGDHKVSRFKVERMLERMGRVAFEEFDGSWWDYLLWATDPRAYERIEGKHRREE